MKKKIIIISSSIIIVAILIGITLYFTTDLFKSNEKLFWKYFLQIEDISDVISNDKLNLEKEFKKSNSYISNGNLSFNYAKGEDSSKEFKIETTSKYDINSNKTYADAILKNGELDLFKISYINYDDIYAIKCDEVYERYIGIKNSNLTELGKKYGFENVPDTININEYENLLKLSEEEKTHILNTYVPIIMENIDSKQYKKETETIEINNIQYETNTYKIEISGDTLKIILINCLNKLKQDQQLLSIINERISKVTFNNLDITNKIDDLIKEIEQYNINETLNIEIYESNGKNIRTKVSLGTKINIIYDRLNNENTLTMDFEQKNNIQEFMNANEIIDLTEIGNDTNFTTRIIIAKKVQNNLTLNNIQIIPDINKNNENIDILVQIENKDDDFNNLYDIKINKNENEKQEQITITYNNEITKTNQVENIKEINNENLVLANNFQKEQFELFIQGWSQIFLDKFKEKMSIIGFDEISQSI